MECKRNKWDCEEGGDSGHLQRRKVQVACLDRDEIEREWKGKASRCGVSGIIAVVQEMERAKEWVPILLNDVWHR